MLQFLFIMGTTRKVSLILGNPQMSPPHLESHSMDLKRNGQPHGWVHPRTLAAAAHGHPKNRTKYWGPSSRTIRNDRTAQVRNQQDQEHNWHSRLGLNKSTRISFLSVSQKVASPETWWLLLDCLRATSIALEGCKRQWRSGLIVFKRLR